MKTIENKIIKKINELSKLIVEYNNGDFIIIRNQIVKCIQSIVNKKIERKKESDIANEEYLKNLYIRSNKC